MSKTNMQGVYLSELEASHDDGYSGSPFRNVEKIGNVLGRSTIELKCIRKPIRFLLT